MRLVASDLCGSSFRLGCRSMLDDGAYLGTRTAGLTLAAPVMLGEDDRRRHLYLIGKTGTGKSTLLLSLILADPAPGAASPCSTRTAIWQGP